LGEQSPKSSDRFRFSSEDEQAMYSRKSLENATLCIVALTLSAALMRLLSSGGDTLDGDPRAQTFLALCYLSVTAIAIVHFRWAVVALRRNPAVVALVVLGFLSAFWAQSQDLVFRRAIAVAGTTLFAVVVSIRLTFEEQLRLFRWATRIAAGLSLALLILAPNAAIASGVDGGTVRGIFNHKNHLGAAMALGFLMELYCPETQRKAKLLRNVFLFAYLALLASSNSMTSVVALAATLLVTYCFNFLHLRCKLPLPLLFTLVLVVAGVAMGVQDYATQMLGRSSDLTGRTELWSFTLSMIAKRPLFGYGLSGFWMGASDETVAIQEQFHWTPIYAHNGFLEIAVSLGVVGLLLFLVMFATGIKRVLNTPQLNPLSRSTWPIAFLTFFLVHNMGECTILVQNSLEWSLCVATVISSDALLLNSLSAAAERRKAARIPVAEYA
jgi:exopolysaccharide production protein ExoQ